MNQMAYIVLLLFAVMVVAGGALVLFGPEDGSPEAPVIAFDEEHEADEVVVESVSPGLTWDEIQVQISISGGFRVEGGNLTRAHGMVFTPVNVDEDVREGDALRICVDRPGEEENGVEVTLRHVPSGRIMGSWTLQSVDSCGGLDEQEDGEESAVDGGTEGDAGDGTEGDAGDGGTEGDAGDGTEGDAGDGGAEGDAGDGTEEASG